MATRDDNPNYSFKPGEYQPSPGDLDSPDYPDNSLSLGYHNESLLRDNLAAIIQISKEVIEAAEKDLLSYSLKITPGSKLHQAQIQEWPPNMGEPKMYISFEEYKALERVQSRGSEYIRQMYEGYIRGPFGSNSVDVIYLANALKTEAEHILKFLDKYLGDIDDSSEYRTLELFQDWSEAGLDHAANVAALFTKRRESKVSIPSSEMDQIGEEDARSYQAFFQTKINTVNKEISQLIEDIDKEHSVNSEIFYEKFLGPSLQFRLKVGRNLESNMGGLGFLAKQALEADRAFEANHRSLMADQMKRIENFEERMEGALVRVYARDNYSDYTRQLNTRIEKETKTPFIKTEVKDEEIEGFKEFTTAIIEKTKEDNSFTSAHNLLDGRDALDAHEQYLLKSGGMITGDIDLDEDVKIDGMRPGQHRHRGLDVDGTHRIRGEDIEDLVTTSIKKDEDICRPSNLRHINNQPFTGTNMVTLVNSQVAWDCDPDLTFEVQTVPIGVKPTTPKPTVEYCVTTLYETDLDIVAGLGSDFDFFTFATRTAVYNYNWTTGILTRIAGAEGQYGDVTGDSVSKARFGGIVDVTQDFFDGRVYIADGPSRKIKMTDRATTSGHNMPMDIKTMYNSPFDIKRIDSQGQNFLNTLYVLIGPDSAGKDRVIKLVDVDGNNLQAGTYAPSEIAKISGVYSDIIDIAVTPNGFVYLLGGTILYQYDPNSNTVRNFDVSEPDSEASPTAITSDQYGDIYITYSSTSL